MLTLRLSYEGNLVKKKRLPEGAQCEPDRVLVLPLQILLDGVRHEHENLLLLVEERHHPEVPDPLLREARPRDEFEALHLSKVGGVPQHLKVHELRDVPVPHALVLPLEGRPELSALLRDDSPLLGRCLALANAPNEIPEPRHVR